MSRRILNSFFGGASSNADNEPSPSNNSSVRQIIVQILRATLSASAVTYHEALEETGMNTKPVEKEISEVPNYSIKEANREALSNARNAIYEIELETRRTHVDSTCYDDQDSSFETTTPKSRASRPSTSSGLFSEDLGKSSSEEYPPVEVIRVQNFDNHSARN
eukprot:g6985.t1